MASLRKFRRLWICRARKIQWYGSSVQPLLN